MSAAIARDALQAELARAAADEAGVEPGAIGATALERFVDHSVRRGEDLAALAERARAKDPWLLEALLSAVLVGETFFFRDPEHFELVREVLSARPERARRGLSGWSAGCASGEEAYSLAATLRAIAGGAAAEVLGTDLSQRALDHARAGVYGKWSRRGPMLHPIGDAARGELRVRDDLRAHVRFQRHNLLDPPPTSPGGFDVILCRNVFVYLRADAARRVAAHLRSALAPGGLLIVGALGPIEDPSLVPTGPRELGAYLREPAAAAPPPRPAPPPPRPATPTRPPLSLSIPPPSLAPRSTSGMGRLDHTLLSTAPLSTSPADHVKVHLEAIHLIDAQRLAEADILLTALVNGASYVPALLDLALISERRGAPARAAQLASRLLELLAGRDPEEEILGPETLPAQYYTSSAEAILGRLTGLRGGP